jgi:hypothetical protein
MTAPVKTYRVKVRIVGNAGRESNRDVHVNVDATNSTAADAAAVAEVKRDNRGARAVVAIGRRKIADPRW